MKKAPLFVSLDVDDTEKALEIALVTSPYVTGFKVGPRLILKNNFHEFLQKLRPLGELFLDCKYFDIPNTMKASVKTSFDLGFDFVTIHGLSGPESLSLLSELEKELNKIRDFKILVVTILTSYNLENLSSNLKKQSIKDHVLEIVKTAYNRGLKSFVCSPDEIELIKNKYPEAFLMTPGIRLSNNNKNDQKRVLSPKEALLKGADGLVVGRPICESKSPLNAVKEFYSAINNA